MSSQDLPPPPDDSYPPPPPVEAPAQQESRGSMRLGILIGFFGCILAVLCAGRDLERTLEFLRLLPLVALGVGITLTVITPTRPTGIGVLIGFAIFPDCHRGHLCRGNQHGSFRLTPSKERTGR